MIFTCGVRFMRAKSAGVSGRLSGSRAAAASISSCVIGRIGLGVLCEVVILLTFGCAPRRDQAQAAIPFGIANKQDNTFGHPDKNDAVLTIVLALVETLDGKRVGKSPAGPFEVDAVLGVVLGVLRLIPLKG